MTIKGNYWCVAGALFAGFLALYVALPTRDLYWDGAGFALAVDHPLWFGSIEPNHPLYIGFGRAVHSLVRIVVPGLGGLGLLQALNAILGAISVALVYLIAHETIADRLDSALIAGLFGISATWWKFATDANAYIPPLVLLLVAARLLLPMRKARPVLVGLLHTCAMLFHVLAAVFLVPAATGLCLQNRGDRRAAMRATFVYLATVLFLSSTAYYTCFRIVTGQNDAAAFVRWVTYHTPDSNFSFDVAQNAWLTVRGTTRLLVGGRVNNFDSGRILDLGILVGLSALGMVFVRRAGPARFREPYPKLLPLFCSWIIAYAAFLFFWLPQNTFYRLFYLPPLALLAGIASRRFAGRTVMYAALALVGMWNYAFFIHPHSQVEKNAVARSGMAMRSIWKPGTWVYVGSFNSDNWIVFCFNPQVMFKELDRAKLAGASAEIQSLNRAGSETWLDRSGIDLLQSEPAGRQWLAEHTRPGFSRNFSDAKHKIGFERIFP